MTQSEVCAKVTLSQTKACVNCESEVKKMKIKLDTKKIYLAMAEKGLTITEIAKQGGVSQQAVSSALNGNRVGRVKVVPAICDALGFKAKDIVIIED